MLGKGQNGGYPSETTGELLQSGVPVDIVDKKGHQVGGQLTGGVQVGPQQQNQQLLLTPASLQLAQLQAQLTLHRLKLAQGGNTANAATVLNQVLSNVAMSQPLFNQLRTSTMLGNPQGGFPTGVLGFPSSSSALGALGVGTFNQNPGNVRLNHQGGGTTVGQQSVEFGKKSDSQYPSDTDRRLNYNLGGGTSAASATAGDGQFMGISTQAKNMNNVGFQQDFYGQDVPGQQAGFGVTEQNMNVFNSTGQKEQWKGPANLSHAGKLGMGSDAASVWTAAGQPMRSRTELYNPEEPTTDPKFSAQSGVPTFGSSSLQGFGVYHPQHGSEDVGTRTLQPYQVNDYNAVTPTQLPHICSICDKKVYNLKDWDQHVKGKLHLQNRMLYTKEGSAVVSAGAVHYPVGRPSDGGLNTGGTNSMIYSAASQDVSTGATASFLPAAAMKTYPLSNTGFTSHQPESKPFPPRKATAGRVVHICNLPEGSCTENDVINLGIPFGKVTNYILMRSTHQAFIEMGYVEAAQAMVQYYQLTPAMINNQKLLIRMSKRYKELQLKKPGKDVQSIIHDLTSQRERDEMQELEHYMPDRARSRSPVSRSLSPHSHSPSFTSCSSAHSPQGLQGRGQERGSNGLGPRRGSWDWSSHFRRGEDEKERDGPWRNGNSVDDDRPNERVADRRKAYQKPSDYVSSRSADERGGGGGGGGGGDEGMRGSRDRYPRGSPQGLSFNSYRNMEDDFYMKEQMYKPDKLTRSPYQRHDTKSKRRDGGDHHGRSRHLEMTDEPLRRTPEDKRQNSPSRGRSKKTSRRHTNMEKHERESATENNDHQSKDESVSPQRSNKPKESTECSKHKDTEKDRENGDNTDEECWYPKNMEELVTVDEVGGEDDSIVEPDLPELEELVSYPKQSAEDKAMEENLLPSTSSLEVQETSDQKLREDAGEQSAETSIKENAGNVLPEIILEEQILSPVISEPPLTNLSAFPTEEFKAALEETCLEDKVTDSGPVEEPIVNHICVSEDSKTQDAEQVTETITNTTKCRDGILKTEIEAPSSTRDQDKAVSERSIPLGVEFIVQRTGFYCNLCDLFYTSEETAKTTHCRSTVHYRNLQKYLSQLAHESLMGALAEPSTTQ